MQIRKSHTEDLPRMMEIYAYARQFMAEHGNPNQWGPTNWPPEELIRADIAAGKSYVCIHEGRIVGCFFFQYGPDIEPTYRVIEDGAWRIPGPYGVIHRMTARSAASAHFASSGRMSSAGTCASTRMATTR